MKARAKTLGLTILCVLTLPAGPAQSQPEPTQVPTPLRPDAALLECAFKEAQRHGHLARFARGMRKHEPALAQRAEDLVLPPKPSRRTELMIRSLTRDVAQAKSPEEGLKQRLSLHNTYRQARLDKEAREHLVTIRKLAAELTVTTSNLAAISKLLSTLLMHKQDEVAKDLGLQALRVLQPLPMASHLRSWERVLTGLINSGAYDKAEPFIEAFVTQPKADIGFFATIIAREAPDAAVALLTRMPPGLKQRRTRSELVQKLTRSGRYTLALDLARAFKDPMVRTQELAALASKCLEAGSEHSHTVCGTKATEAALKSLAPQGMEVTRKWLARPLASLGRLSEAEAIASKIAIPLVQWEAYSEIALAAAKQGDVKRARRLAKLAFKPSREATSGNRQSIAGNVLEALYLIGAVTEADAWRASLPAEDKNAVQIKMAAEALARGGDYAKAAERYATLPAGDALRMWTLLQVHNIAQEKGQLPAAEAAFAAHCQR